MALFARRRPLSSTRVLFAPIPRRSANEAPPVALPTERLELYTPWLPESRPISSSVLVTPCWRSSSARRTLIGTAVSASTRRIALPVTSIRCNWTVGGSTGACPSAAVALLGASWRASSRAAPSGGSVWSDRCMVGASLVPVCPGMSVEPGIFQGRLRPLRHEFMSAGNKPCRCAFHRRAGAAEPVPLPRSKSRRRGGAVASFLQLHFLSAVVPIIQGSTQGADHGSHHSHRALSQHRHRRPRRRRQDHDDRADPLLHRRQPQDGRGP